MEKFNQILRNVLIFLVIYIGISYVFQSCQGKDDPMLNSGNLYFATSDTEYSRREVVTVAIANDTKDTITIPNQCPGEPFDVYRFENNEWVQKISTPALHCEESKEIILAPGQKTSITYDNWNNALFAEMGKFKIEYKTTFNGAEKTFTTSEFLVSKEGIFRQIWIEAFYRPIYNGLIFFASIMPNNNLGLAIILLTIVIRTLLLLPSHKAMKAQRRMQEVQPRLNKIKEKHKGDQQRIAMETMALWKEAKISPFSSCLPLILQLPFLIALFQVIQSGLNPDNAYLLYADYGLAINNIEINFFGLLDLTKVDRYALPIITGALQFVQMKLSMTFKNKKDEANGVKQEKNEMTAATNMMIYILPVMSSVFTAVLPAGVGLYWATSTIYGIVQQLFINRDKGSTDHHKDEPSVKVIEPSATKN
ncbi:MAG: YidC/Oxa1 family membrane protein insertase [Patescibacteria group bacterium]|mgnify:CR=1 FL=1